MGTTSNHRKSRLRAQMGKSLGHSGLDCPKFWGGQSAKQSRTVCCKLSEKSLNWFKNRGLDLGIMFPTMRTLRGATAVRSWGECRQRPAHVISDDLQYAARASSCHLRIRSSLARRSSAIFPAPSATLIAASGQQKLVLQCVLCCLPLRWAGPQRRHHECPGVRTQFRPR